MPFFVTSWFVNTLFFISLYWLSIAGKNDDAMTLLGGVKNSDIVAVKKFEKYFRQKIIISFYSML